MAKPTNDNQKDAVEEAVQQFIDKRMQGREPDIDEFVKQYPELEHRIRQKIQNLRKIDTLFDSLVQADEDDFEDEVTVIRDELIGRKLGGFEIVEVIGRGGMGVVYLAHDTRLNRSVAIKGIPAKLADDSTARMRFDREAKLLASLNHPNIAVIHEIIEEDTGYLVLEYVPGQTLAERIAKGPLKLEEALSIALQLAEAVAAAHEHDVIHRDLKPRNIKIMPEGRVKVLDFGLAKPAGGEAESQDITVTQIGSIIGTPAYMSPQQIRGGPIDHRADIWSFGCVLYEMLTGKRPFEGDTVSDTVAHILERQPDWDLLPQDTPANIKVLLRRCLEKDPDQRLGDIGDAAIEISETLSKPQTAAPVKLRKIAMIISAVAVGIILFVIISKYFPEQKIQPSSSEIRLVVLPLENLGFADDEWFADGMTDEITSRLAGIHGLGVISRNSSMQYKNREKSTPQIVKELNVDYILEGTIQRERPSDPNSKVRIRFQLIKAADDTHVWTQSYDNDMSEVFRLQSEVAERVAQAMDVTLLEPERRALASIPTENIEAYNYYLRGYDYSRRSYLESDQRTAIRMYEKAIELDPTFALAYAGLSDAHRLMHWFHYDHSNARLVMAKKAVDKALELDPGLFEARRSLGFYFYQGHLDYDRALEQFAIARKSQPNNVLRAIGFVQRRQGKFEQALDNLKKGSELDPIYHFSFCDVGTTFTYLRKYPEAERYYERAISLAPDVPSPYSLKVRLYLRWEGSTEKARAVLKEALQNTKLAEDPGIVNSLVALDVLDGNYQEALDRLSLKSQDTDNQDYIDDHDNFIPNALLYARIYRYMGDNQKAKEHFEQAKDILKSKIDEDPNDDRYRSSLGIAYAGLGRKVDAIREGKLATELLPVSKEALAGVKRVEDLAHIYVMVGEHNDAIDTIKYLLSKPGLLSIPLLRLDPAWDSLRKHPRFIELIESGK